MLYFGSDSSFQLTAVDRVNIAEGQLLTWCFDVTDSSHNFRALIVWTDPAGDVYGDLALVHDLDLTVVDAAEAWHWGNARYVTDQTNGKQPHRDSINNAEQVTLVRPRLGPHTVRVSGTDVQALGGQNFALVVTGAYIDGSCAVQ